MKLDGKQIEAITKYIKEHFDEKFVCSQCTSDEWAIYDSIYELREFSNGGITVGGPIIPLIVINCNKCGHTTLINAMSVGVVKQKEEKEEKNKND